MTVSPSSQLVACKQMATGSPGHTPVRRGGGRPAAGPLAHAPSVVCALTENVGLEFPALNSGTACFPNFAFLSGRFSLILPHRKSHQHRAFLSGVGSEPANSGPVPHRICGYGGRGECVSSWSPQGGASALGDFLGSVLFWCLWFSHVHA